MWVLSLRQEVDRPGCLDHELYVLHFDLLTLLSCQVIAQELVYYCLQADFEKELVLLDIFQHG